MLDAEQYGTVTLKLGAKIAELLRPSAIARVTEKLHALQSGAQGKREKQYDERDRRGAKRRPLGEARELFAQLDDESSDHEKHRRRGCSHISGHFCRSE